MDIDDVKKGLEEVASSIESVEQWLCEDHDGLSLQEVSERLAQAEDSMEDISGRGRGMCASDRLDELMKEFAAIEEERDGLEAKRDELEAKVKELEDRIEELG